MSKSIKWSFLERSMIGQQTDISNSDIIIDKCVSLAYKDMLTAGRYYHLPDEIKENFTTILKDNIINANFHPKTIIGATLELFGKNEKIGIGNKYVTRYGLCQKLVNMTFKYLYVFSDYTGLNLNFSECDCPLDSVILKSIEKENIVWSKLTAEQYDTCQQKIKNKLAKISLNSELSVLGNLAYDFLNW